MSPVAPPKPCTRQPCAEMQPCSTHGKRANEYGRTSAAKRGYGRTHQRWRRMVLARNPLCVGYPLGQGTCRPFTPATVADHIVPLSRGGTWSLDNGQGLCPSCHARKSTRE